MVKTLTQQDQAALQAAIAQAEAATNAKLRVTVHAASDRYQDFVLLYGFITGSIVAMTLWAAGILGQLPWLIAAQFVTIILMDLLPILRRTAVMLVSARIKTHRAARLAFEEYHAHHNTIAAGSDFVLLYVSLAEHYVHVITSPSVHARLPDQWDAVIDGFTKAMRKDGLAIACVAAVEHIARKLKQP